MFTLLLLLPLASATLTFVTPRTSSTLQSYGTAEITASLLLSTSPDETIVDHSITLNQPYAICTDQDLSISDISSEQHNVTVSLAFDGFPGEMTYTVSLITRNEAGLHRSYTATGVIHVYGVAFYEDVDGKHTIYSGDTAPPLSFEKHSAQPRKLLSKIHAPNKLKLEDAVVVIRGMSTDADALVISQNGVKFDDESLSLQPNEYRVGAAVLTLEIPDLELMGELFETQIVLSVPNTPRPPPVIASTGEINATQHKTEMSFSIDMFNVPDVEVFAQMCGGRLQGIVDKSTFEKVNQTVTFSGTCREGKYAPEVYAMEHDVSVKAANSGTLFISVSDSGRPKVSGKERGRTGRLWAIVGGVVAAVVAVTAGVIAIVSWRRRQAILALEKSFCSTEADFGSDVGVEIIRDVYGRGSVSYAEV